MIDEATGLLDAVDAALVRLSEGTYRDCEVCGGGLDDAALAADPTLRRCMLHRESA